MTFVPKSHGACHVLIELIASCGLLHKAEVDACLNKASKKQPNIAIAMAVGMSAYKKHYNTSKKELTLVSKLGTTTHHLHTYTHAGTYNYMGLLHGYHAATDE